MRVCVCVAGFPVMRAVCVCVLAVPRWRPMLQQHYIAPGEVGTNQKEINNRIVAFSLSL